MEQFETWREAITASLQELFNTIVQFLPNLAIALLVLIVGLLIAGALGSLVARMIAYTRVDHAIDKLGINKALGFGKIKVSGIIGWLVKWFLIVVVLMAVTDILELTQITAFLNDVVDFLPNVVIAVVILLIGFVGGNFVYEIVHRSVKAARMHSPRFLANLAKWSIVVFALIAALTQLQIAAALVQTVFIGLIGMLALAGGLAFGLGGQRFAAEWLEDLKKNL